MDWVQRLNDKFATTGWSKAELSKRANVPYDSVLKYLDGKVKQPRGDIMERLAKALDTTVLWLEHGVENEPLTKSLKKPAKLGMVPVKGRVKAGDWQDIDSWGAGFMSDWVPSSSEFPLEWQYAYTVDGESLNKTARHGDRLVCLDLGESGGTFEDGDLVIVERSRYSGQMVERTAKRARKTLAGFELWPESTDPEHQTAIPYRGNDESDQVRVVARVLWILRKP
jgi:transcriptional regulator with XRE-family HTH domain